MLLFLRNRVSLVVVSVLFIFFFFFFCYPSPSRVAIWLCVSGIRFCRFLSWQCHEAKVKLPHFMCAPRTVHTPLRNRYIIYFNIIWCDGAASAAAVVQNLFVSSRFSLAIQYRSISVALRERQRTYVQLHETTRSVQYFCRSRFFSSLSALSLVFSSLICSPLIPHRSKLVPLWLL